MSIDPISVVETYLDRLHDIRSGRKGTPELSYRAALENLINAVGGRLDQRTGCASEAADDTYRGRLLATEGRNDVSPCEPL